MKMKTISYVKMLLCCMAVAHPAAAQLGKPRGLDAEPAQQAVQQSQQQTQQPTLQLNQPQLGQNGQAPKIGQS